MYDAATAIKLDWPRPTTGVKLVENLAYRRAGTDFYEQEINSALGRMLLGLIPENFQAVLKIQIVKLMKKLNALNDPPKE